MDLQMPEMNGLDSTKHIRLYEHQQNLKPCKILAVTAFISDQDKQECFKAGMNGFLGKPVTQSLMSDIIVKMKLDDK